jgi:hypothetical protein
LRWITWLRARQLAARQVDRQIPDLDAVGACRRALCCRLLAGEAHATQEGLDPRQQLAHAERLGQVVVGPHLQAHHAIHFVGARRQHQDRDVHLLAQNAAHLKAVQAREHHIEHDEVGLLATGDGEGGMAVGGGHDRVSLTVEVIGERLDQRRLIFDHQNLLAHTFLSTKRPYPGGPT